MLVTERDRLLVPLMTTQTGFRATAPIRIVDFPPEPDVESIAWLGGNRFAVGTEKDRRRTKDSIYILEVNGDVARIATEISIDFAAHFEGLSLETNRGIEGLCFHKGQLLLAGETVIKRAGTRFAPFIVYNMARKTQTAYRIALSSHEGMVSAIACLDSNDELLRVAALERHFGVARLLTFALDGAGGIVKPTARNLETMFSNHDTPNLEGLVQRGSDFVAVNDNDYGGITGPTQLITFRASANQHIQPPP